MLGQNVLKKPADELFGSHSAESLTVSSRVFVLESHSAMFEFQYPTVADRHSKHVRRQVLECSFARPHRLRVNYPFFLPHPSVHLFEQLGLLQQVSEFCTKDYRQGAHRDEKGFA